ncbi:hypothetical protein L5515_000626 [Caenorhabditis briggsae]|uniref:Decapping nuclease n=1 Tax=Caenorhabditis briggsae TaxID=6238 RepID=A0AAE9E0A7_CAEBR|nr:hypothetical protein L5515_000626 [Caenorhabditis briggsae]
MATEKSQDFNITSVGYYKRDNEMNVTVDVQPKFANSNYDRLMEFQEPGDYIQEIDMNLGSPEVPHDGKLRIFLNLYSIIFRSKARFVTPTVYIVSHMGMIFMSYKKLEKADPEIDEEDQKKKDIARKKAMEYTAGANFAHYWTKKSENEEIPEDYATSNCKAVMKCDVEVGGKKELVVYSAHIDALEKESGKHVSTRTTRRTNFWTYRSLHWKMFFGNDSTMVLGAGSVSLELSNWALRSIEALKFEDVFAKMEKIRREKNEERAQCEEFKKAPFQKWTMDQGKERFRQFLSQVKNACTHSDGCFLATEANKMWHFEKVDEEHDEIREFASLVKTKMAVWKINFPNECS